MYIVVRESRVNISERGVIILQKIRKINLYNTYTTMRTMLYFFFFSWHGNTLKVFASISTHAYLFLFCLSPVLNFQGFLIFIHHVNPSFSMVFSLAFFLVGSISKFLMLAFYLQIHQKPLGLIFNRVQSSVFQSNSFHKRASLQCR